MRWVLPVLLCLSGCVKRAPDGTVLRRIPHCETQGRSVRARPLDEAVQSCTRLLAIEGSDASRSLLGLTTDKAGRVSDVCIVGSTHDADSRFLNCVADQLLAASVALPPDQTTPLVWTLNLSY